MTSITSRDMSHEPTVNEGLSSWWAKFKSKPARKEHEPSRSIFNVPLQESITYANVAISLYNDDGQTFIYGYIPIVVAKCGLFLKDNATETEGIFRLSGSAKRIKELQAIFDQPPKYGKGLDWAGFTVHDAANILRRYLNHLPDPIIPYDWYDAFREPLKENWTTNKTIKRMQELVASLPALNRQLLLYILDLLAVFASKSEINRMTSENLSAIFQPGLITHPRDDMAPQEYRLSQEVLVFLIDNQSHFLLDSLCSPDKAQASTPPGQKKSSISRRRTLQAQKSGTNPTQLTVKQNVVVGGVINSVEPPGWTTSVATANLSRSNTVPTKRLPPNHAMEQSTKPRYVSTPVATRIPVHDAERTAPILERDSNRTNLGMPDKRESSLGSPSHDGLASTELASITRARTPSQGNLSSATAQSDIFRQGAGKLKNDAIDTSPSENSSVLGGESEFSIISGRRGVQNDPEIGSKPASPVPHSSTRPISMNVSSTLHERSSHARQTRNTAASPSKFSNLFKKKPRNQSASSTSEAGARRDLES